MLAFPALPGIAETMGGKIDPLGSCTAFLSKICALRNDASMPIAGLRQVTALRRGAEQPFATIRVGRSGRLRHRAWEGQGSAGRHERAALLRGKRAGCGNANFLRKKAACLDAAR